LLVGDNHSKTREDPQEHIPDDLKFPDAVLRSRSWNSVVPYSSEQLAILASYKELVSENQLREEEPLIPKIASETGLAQSQVTKWVVKQCNAVRT